MSAPETRAYTVSVQTIDASPDLATIRLRTATALYDIDVEWLTARSSAALLVDTTRVVQVPTWEGVQIPDDLTVGPVAALLCWKRGVTDANSAGGDA
jgi:hypothetical protein